LNWKLKKEIIEKLEKEKGYKVTKRGGDVNLLFIYPNEYSTSVNNLGYTGLYKLLNDQEGILCERAYIPSDWKRRENFKVYSMETFRSAKDFDVWLFSVSFELDFFNVIQILSMEKIPILSKERDDSFPIIIGGGIALSSNPEPISEVFDLVFIGEGEDFIEEMSLMLLTKRENNWDKKRFLIEAQNIEGVYVPSFLSAVYNKDGGIEKYMGSQKIPIKRRIYLNFPEDPMVSPIVTDEAAFSDMALCELVRGCKYQCRFCLAGYFYRPYRASSIDKVYKKVKELYEEQIPKLGFIVPTIDQSIKFKGIGSYLKSEEIIISFSSLRLEDITSDILDIIGLTNQKTVTIAPETGSDRLRRVLNKKFTNEDILNFVEILKDYPVNTIKLYFMLGLPTEEEEDIQKIVELITNIRKINKNIEISTSFSTFIPKVHTPFQWEKLAEKEYILETQKFLKKNLKEISKLKIEMKDYYWSLWQGILSRGDRRIGSLWNYIYKDGLKKNVLQKFLEEDSWAKEVYLYKEKGSTEYLPWDIIDTGVKKEYLWKEREKAYRGEITLPCTQNCKMCGVCT